MRDDIVGGVTDLVDLANRNQPMRNRHLSVLPWGASITSPDALIMLCVNDGAVLDLTVITNTSWRQRSDDSRMAMIAGRLSQLLQGAIHTTHGRIDAGFPGGGPMVRTAA